MRETKKIMGDSGLQCSKRAEGLVGHARVEKQLSQMAITDLTQASIREIVRLSANLESESGVDFVHMEMGVPGLNPPEIGVKAEVEALKKGAAQCYPPVEGTPSLKQEMARFVKNFVGIEVNPTSVVPGVGSMQGGMAVFMLVNRLVKGRDRVLFIDPGFPVQKQQLKVLGFEFDSFDAGEYREEKLRAKLESFLKKGRTSAIVYSNPNNPTWMCLTEGELRVIAELSNEYDTPIVEDLAYFGMDFRKDISTPGEPPYQASVAHYTDKWIMLISSSKAFSFSGERIGCVVVNDSLFTRKYPDLKNYFPSAELGRALIYGAVYALSSGVSAGAQAGFTAMLKACNEGTYNFVEPLRVYEHRARRLKELFLSNGFELVYSHDGAQPLADGFYFTLAYPGLSGHELLFELLKWGISAISLASAGSERVDGVRACVSHVRDEQIENLAERLSQFDKAHRCR